MPMLKTIKVSDETHKKLGTIGKLEETYDKVICRLIANYEENQKETDH